MKTYHHFMKIPVLTNKNLTAITAFFLYVIAMISFAGCINTQKEIPLVYDVEFTEVKHPTPSLLPAHQLPSIKPLPDPFIWAEGGGRDTTFTSWKKHRAEYKAMFEYYEIGVKPPKPESIKASFTNNTLAIVITHNDSTLTITSKVTLPEGEGPFPAIIGIGRGSGSLPSHIFEARNIAQIAFDFRQVMAHQQNRGSEPINKLYPKLSYIGAYSAWPWGISRIIDALEQLQDVLPIDLKHIGVTGCSFAGKMALFSGALDERIALTIAQESGGGGYPAWRVSETLGKVETLARTDHHWFIEDMWQFANQVDKWANMIDAMQLNGRLRQLAIHATISEESTDDSFILQLDQATKHLKTDNAQQLLENFVCDYLQRKVSVEINVVEQTIADPYQIQSHINDKRYEYAKDLLLKDEIVIQFQQQFQATIDEETIVAL